MSKAKRNKHLFKTIPCVVPANVNKKLQVTQLLAEYQIVMSKLIHVMKVNMLQGNSIQSFTKLKPKDIGTDISARYLQTSHSQAYETFSSYQALLQKKIRYMITMSNISDERKYTLYRINNWQAWYYKTLSLPWKTIDNELIACGAKDKNATLIPVDEDDLFLMRKIANKARKWIKLPDLSHVPTMKLDAKVAVLEESRNSFAYWLKLSTLTRGKTINLPLKKNSYLVKQLKKGKLLNFVQVSIKNNNIQISPIVQQETVPIRTSEKSLGIDWGMVSLFTTSDGNRYGTKLFVRLKRLDTQLLAIQRELQEKQQPLKTNPRYQKLQHQIRSLVKNEINRILNKIALEDIGELKLEKLNFSGGGLSRTLNRLLSRMGRAALQQKLQRLNEEQGIVITEVNPAYTSQMCNRCGYVDKQNRKQQKEFRCLCCGHHINADVNAARNIQCRRSALRLNKYELKSELLKKHAKACSTGKHSSIMVK